VTINLEPAGDGKTNLIYSAGAVIGCPVAGVGQRMINGAAKRIAGQFFTAIDTELTSRAAEEARATAAAVSSTTAPTAEGVPAGTFPAFAAQVSASKAAASVGGATLDPRSFLLGDASGNALTAGAAPSATSSAAGRDSRVSS